MGDQHKLHDNLIRLVVVGFAHLRAEAAQWAALSPREQRDALECLDDARRDLGHLRRALRAGELDADAVARVQELVTAEGDIESLAAALEATLKPLPSPEASARGTVVPISGRRGGTDAGR